MARDIGAAFRLLGGEVRDFEYLPGWNVPELFPDLMDWLAESDNGALLADINGAILTSAPVVRAMERHPGAIDSFSFMTDTPLHFPSRLENWPLGGMVGVVDASFFDLTRFMKYQRPYFVLHPHAGPDVAPDIMDMSARDIEFLFIGNISKSLAPDDHARELYGNEPALIPLFVSSFGNLVADKTPFQVTLQTARELPGTYTKRDVALISAHLENYFSSVSRLKVLTSLAEFNVTVVGKVDQDALTKLPGIRAIGFQPFAACLNLMCRAKVLLNITPSFPNGAHERIFYALSKGTAVVTTRSSFLEADHAGHGFIRFFDIARDDVAEKAIDMQRDLENGKVDRGVMLRHYRANHMWSTRLQPIVKEARRRSTERWLATHG